VRRGRFGLMMHGQFSRRRGDRRLRTPLSVMPLRVVRCARVAVLHLAYERLLMTVGHRGGRFGTQGRAAHRPRRHRLAGRSIQDHLVALDARGARLIGCLCLHRQSRQRVAGGALDARVPVDSGPPELRRLARSFNAMADNVADAFGRQRAFVAQASHQLRNPLAALRIRLDNLADHVDAGGLDEHRETLDEVDRLGLILDGLLALASAERGQHGCRVVDAAAVADQRVAAWQPLAERREITLRRTGAARADARAVVTGVDQALDALIDNALKFAVPGATVLVDVKPGIMSVDIDVVDDGPGLSADERRLAAERFWRAPKAQNVDGAGLGLPIAAVLAEVSGGGLRLLPVSPHGLNAKLTFPRP